MYTEYTALPKPAPSTTNEKKSFIKNRTSPKSLARVKEESSDDDAPPDAKEDWSDYDEEVVPVSSKPFLFGAD